MPFYPSDLLGYLGSGIGSVYRGMMPPLPKSEEEERKAREKFLASDVPAWTDAEIAKNIQQQVAADPMLQRAFAAQQQQMVAERARSAAAPRRAYPIDAYGSTPEERIRTVQNLNAAESGGEQIMEQAGPHMGMFGYDPAEVAAFQNRPRYEFSPDQAPQQAAADAAMERAQADRTAARARLIEAEAYQQQQKSDQNVIPDIIRQKLIDQADALPPGSEERKAIEERIKATLLNQQRGQPQASMMRRPSPMFPVLGRPMSLSEMIQNGWIA